MLNEECILSLYAVTGGATPELYLGTVEKPRCRCISFLIGLKESVYALSEKFTGVNLRCCKGALLPSYPFPNFALLDPAMADTTAPAAGGRLDGMAHSEVHYFNRYSLPSLQ